MNENAIIPLAVFAAMAIGGVGGYMIQGLQNKQPAFSIGKSVDAFDEVLFYVQEQYVDSVDIEYIREEAIENVLAELDPHSSYLPKDLLQSEQEQMKGEYEGIGIEFAILKDTITVMRVMPDGPSDRAQLQSGDQIIYVEGELFTKDSISNTEVVKRLKGPKNSSVSIQVKRFGEPELLPITIRRGPISIESVPAAYLLTEQVGYIKINQFSNTTAKEVKVHLDKLVNSGMQNLILDLRGNGGGSMQSCLEMLDQFIDGNKLMLTAEGRKYKKQNYEAYLPGKFEQGEIIVLIDQGSASASEIVAGAIQDWDRGIIMGRRSFGKGLVQKPYQLSDGAGLRLTVARYYTPSGRSIQRPYEQGVNSYYEDYYERYVSGELIDKDSVKIDSSLLRYTLINQREVFGGGGIYPDIFIPIDTAEISSFTRKIFTERVLHKYAFRYLHDQKQVLNSYQSPTDFENQFLVTSSIYNDFITYAKSQLNETEYTQEQINLAKEELSVQLKALLGRQLFGEEGYYTVLNDTDDMVLRALSIFRDNSYSQLLVKNQ